MSTPLQLSGPQIGKLNEVLRNAFNPNTFSNMLLYRLDKSVYDIAPIGSNFEDIVSAVIVRANMEGWWSTLVLRAREANPGNPKLLAFAQQFGLSTNVTAQIDQGGQMTTLTLTTRQEVERIVQPQNPLLDVNVWREELGKLEGRICRIEIETDQGKVVTGTGFLFGADNAVLTNYHVMEPVIRGVKNETTADGLSAKPEKVECRFDYKRMSNGTVLNLGVTFKLAGDWLIDHSPNYPLDQLPPDDCLDYAYIRLESKAGDDTVGDKNNQAGEKRGHIPFPVNPFNPASGSGVSIMQHPRGEPLKLALDDDGVLGLNENGTRLMYETNTEKGSSGSPCFTFKWELIALHHSGDPDFDPAHKPTYNEGIPMTAILKLFTSRNVAAKLTADED